MLDGAVFGFRDEDGNVIDLQYLQRCGLEYRRAVEFMVDHENGLFVLSHSEYEALPATLIDAIRIYRFERTKQGNPP